MNENEAKEFIASVEWTRAKTYERTSPHEYAIIKIDNPLRNKAVAFMNYIFDHGVEEPYYGHPFTVYYLGDRKYWVMVKSKDEIDDETYIINRTVPETTYKIYE